MAEIVLGMATPHAPQLRLPLEGWYALQQKDQTDKRINYGDLLRKAKSDIEDDISEQRMQERNEASKANLRALSDKLQAVAPDTIVIVGDDQREQFHDENMPMFCVYRGSSVDVVFKREGNGHGGSQTWNAPRLREIEDEVAETFVGPRQRPAEPALAEHLIDSLRNDSFDISVSSSLRPGIGIGHAFRFLYEYLLPGTETPIVPVMVNTFFPPNQPTPERCYMLGEALRSAIESWESGKRVAIIASGGLSHTIIDEGIDRMTIDAIRDGDAETLKTLPRERINLGTSEIRNWVTVAAAVRDMDVHFIGDYIPAYRSAAGTGCGMAFAYWTPA